MPDRIRVQTSIFWAVWGLPFCKNEGGQPKWNYIPHEYLLPQDLATRPGMQGLCPPILTGPCPYDLSTTGPRGKAIRTTTNHLRRKAHSAPPTIEATPTGKKMSWKRFSKPMPRTSSTKSYKTSRHGTTSAQPLLR
jgi:hypothetical protein